MTLDVVLNIFKAIGEESRLRIMAVLMRGEVTVSELTHILGQSQPRVSRHLKILSDAGLVERHREGAWMFYRAAFATRGADPSPLDPIIVALSGLAASSDRLIARDRDRFEQSRQARAEAAAAYFEANAGDWDRVRRLHLPEADIEARMLALVGKERIDSFIDIGTGTGRMLELFAPVYSSGVGFDLSREMLAVARANLEQAGVDNAQVRFGDLFALPVEPESADLVCIHQVLHFLAEPGAAVREAARLVRPGGRLIISDFAPHMLEFLREEHAHRRLGFSDDEVADWCEKAGLHVVRTESLAPKSGKKSEVDDRLTVKVWLCVAPEAPLKLKKNVRVAAV